MTAWRRHDVMMMTDGKEGDERLEEYVDAIESLGTTTNEVCMPVVYSILSYNIILLFFFFSGRLLYLVHRVLLLEPCCRQNESLDLWLYPNIHSFSRYFLDLSRFSRWFFLGVSRCSSIFLYPCR